jgi:CheY-like chemotaxis protein
MSHELRTPLNAVLGFAQLLESDAASDEDRESTEQILKAGRHLLGLINEVLDIARIEAGKTSMSPEAVDLDEAVEEALDTIRPLAVAQNVSLHGTTCGRFIRADRQRIKQVLLNLVSNAVKYNRRGGSVTLACETIAETANGTPERLRLSIIDTGIGVSADGLAKLFTPFERLDAAASGVDGIGLGLTVCKRLIALMGGDIGVTSEAGVGSTFWIELPVAENPSASLDVAAAATENGNGARRSMTILYIEDNLSNLRLVQRVLSRRAGVKLIAAMNGEAGIELAEQHQPDLILLDLHLPGTGGAAVLERLRAGERTKEIPVVIVSADATPGQVNRLLAAGAKGYLTKPIEVGAFMRVIDETPGAHRA